jgi:hypothetical protein
MGLDTSKQGKAQTFVNGWVTTSKRFRSIGVLILVLVIAITIFYSLLPAKLAPKKFFPKQASRLEIQRARIIKDIRRFHSVPK